MHPPPGAEGRPSYTSLVSSVDQFTAKYIAISKLQQGRQEIIADLEDMVKYCLSKYRLYQKGVEKSDKAPSRLIFYRGMPVVKTLNLNNIFNPQKMAFRKVNFSRSSILVCPLNLEKTCFTSLLLELMAIKSMCTLCKGW